MASFMVVSFVAVMRGVQSAAAAGAA